ncbi:DUF6370 family protein [Paludisphaera mucosa]|uniref:DUF6370 family protein n=1 Tax=Paludisphaera mucosa TaxID=3030827 RepID=A0ABT6F8L1_9BACT|nr:DUF6370 family protein [Paludisphaera mucosa]MDG3003918.1 DUF6370 family protein [Paludisphaera mucosa]
MRKLLMLAVCGVLTMGLGAVLADEGKKVTIEGDGLCAKCALGEAKECQNAVVVEKDGKKTTYYLEKNEFFKDAHTTLGLCGAKKDSPVKVKVVGTCVEKDGKHILTPTEKIAKVD